MLLLVTLALVVASAVLLILGFVRDALGFIYLSMLCAGVAALALFIFARLTRRRSAALAGVGPSVGGDSPYIGADAAVAPGPADDLEPVAGYEARSDTAAVTVVSAPAAERAGGDEDPWAPSDSADWGDEVVFPIEDYDDLRVAEILPLLSQLDPDELHEVRDRELAGKARATILDRIDDRLLRSGTAAGTGSAFASAPADDTAETAVLPSAGGPAEPQDEVWAAPAPVRATGRRSGRKAVTTDPAPASVSDADNETPASAKRSYTRKSAAEKATTANAAAANSAAASAAAASAAADSAAADSAAADSAAADQAPATKATAKKAAGPAAKTTATKAAGATKATAKKATGATKATAKKATGTTKATAKKATATGKRAAAPAKRATKKSTDT